jgi:hypothetical protein
MMAIAFTSHAPAPRAWLVPSLAARSAYNCRMAATASPEPLQFSVPPKPRKLQRGQGTVRVGGKAVRVASLNCSPELPTDCFSELEDEARHRAQIPPPLSTPGFIQPAVWPGTATEFALKVRDDYRASKTTASNLTAALRMAGKLYMQKNGRAFDARVLNQLLIQVDRKKDGRANLK